MIDEKKLTEERPEWLNPNCAGEEEYNKGWNACNKYWCNTIKRQPKVGEWIPCSEGLPEDEGIMYWTTHEDGSIVMHGYTKKNGFIYNWEVDDLEKRKRQGGVIAWMPLPLPEPYKGE